MAIATWRAKASTSVNSALAYVSNFRFVAETERPFAVKHWPRLMRAAVERNSAAAAIAEDVELRLLPLSAEVGEAVVPTRQGRM